MISQAELSQSGFPNSGSMTKGKASPSALPSTKNKLDAMSPADLVFRGVGRRDSDDSFGFGFDQKDCSWADDIIYDSESESKSMASVVKPKMLKISENDVEWFSEAESESEGPPPTIGSTATTKKKRRSSKTGGTGGEDKEQSVRSRRTSGSHVSSSNDGSASGTSAKSKKERRASGDTGSKTSKKTSKSPDSLLHMSFTEDSSSSEKEFEVPSSAFGTDSPSRRLRRSMSHQVDPPKSPTKNSRLTRHTSGDIQGHRMKSPSARRRSTPATSESPKTTEKARRSRRASTEAEAMVPPLTIGTSGTSEVRTAEDVMKEQSRRAVRTVREGTNRGARSTDGALPPKMRSPSKRTGRKLTKEDLANFTSGAKGGLDSSNHSNGDSSAPKGGRRSSLDSSSIIRKLRDEEESRRSSLTATNKSSKKTRKPVERVNSLEKHLGREKATEVITEARSVQGEEKGENHFSSTSSLPGDVEEVARAKTKNKVGGKPSFDSTEWSSAVDGLLQARRKKKLEAKAGATAMSPRSHRSQLEREGSTSRLKAPFSPKVVI